MTKTSSSSTETDPYPDVSFENLDDKKTRFYTGFVNLSMFMLMFTALQKHGADNLKYWDGEKLAKKSEKNWDRQKPGKKRFLRPIDE